MVSRPALVEHGRQLQNAGLPRLPFIVPRTEPFGNQEQGQWGPLWSHRFCRPDCRQIPTQQTSFSTHSWANGIEASGEAGLNDTALMSCSGFVMSTSWPIDMKLSYSVIASKETFFTDKDAPTSSAGIDSCAAWDCTAGQAVLPGISTLDQLWKGLWVWLLDCIAFVPDIVLSEHQVT